MAVFAIRTYIPKLDNFRVYSRVVTACASDIFMGTIEGPCCGFMIKHGNPEGNVVVAGRTTGFFKLIQVGVVGLMT